MVGSSSISSSKASENGDDLQSLIDRLSDLSTSTANDVLSETFIKLRKESDHQQPSSDSLAVEVPAAPMVAASEPPKVPATSEQLYFTVTTDEDDNQKALGLRPNAALIERIAQRDKKVEQTLENSQQRSTMSAKGDIAFSFMKRKMAKDDDTIGPDLGGGGGKKKDKNDQSIDQKKDGCNTPNPEEELIEEDQVESEPNSENYMYNCKEIVYTCHEMVRCMGKAEISDVAGDVNQSDITGNIKWDPYGPLAELESRDVFNCQTLRRNTLISNSLAMPNEGEKNKYELKLQQTQDLGGGKPPLRVTILDAIYDISEFNANNEMTVVSCTQSISTKRQPSGRVIEAISKKERKRPDKPANNQKSGGTPGGMVKSKESVKTIGGGGSAEKTAGQQKRSSFGKK